MILIYLTKEQIEKHSEVPHFMTRDEINTCMEIDKLRERHRVLFHKFFEGNGNREDLIELMRIVQRMYELGQPFYY